MPSWIQDRETGKLIPAEEYYRESKKKGHEIRADIDPFVSPIDGRVISSRSKLREHNLEHGVTDMRDYGDNWFTKKAQERSDVLGGTSQNERRGRVEAILQSLEKHGVK
jgi:hypothetical protein